MRPHQRLTLLVSGWQTGVQCCITCSATRCVQGLGSRVEGSRGPSLRALSGRAWMVSMVSGWWDLMGHRQHGTWWDLVGLGQLWTAWDNKVIGGTAQDWGWGTCDLFLYQGLGSPGTMCSLTTSTIHPFVNVLQ